MVPSVFKAKMKANSKAPFTPTNDILFISCLRWATSDYNKKWGLGFHHYKVVLLNPVSSSLRQAQGQSDNKKNLKFPPIQPQCRPSSQVHPKQEPYPCHIKVTPTNNRIIILKQRKMIPNQYPFFQYYSIPQSFQYQHSFEYLPFNLPCFAPLPPYPLEECYSPNQSNKYVELRTDENSLVENLQIQQETQKATLQKKLFRSFKKVAPSQQSNDKKVTKGSPEASEQKQGRNANSNLLRMFFRRLQMKLQKESQKIEAIIQKHQLSFTPCQFQEWITRHCIDYRNYVRVSSVKKLFRNQQTAREFSIALRVMLQAFINEESLCCYLTSRKLKKQLMAHSLRSIRNIYSQLFADLEVE